MSVNLLNRVRGAAAFFYMAQGFRTKSVASIDVALAPFDVVTEGDGVADQRMKARLITVKLTPNSVWTAQQLAVLYKLASYTPGQWNTPTYVVNSVVAATDLLTCPAHGIIQGTGVRIGAVDTSAANGTIPGGLAANTTYYVKVVSVDTIKLAPTEADALAGTNLIDITSAGTGKISLIQNTPLIIWTVDGVRLTIWNAAIVQMSGLSLGSSAQPMKEMTIEGYTLHGEDWETENSLYTIEDNVPPEFPAYDPDDIPTVKYTVDWASHLPVTVVTAATDVLTSPLHRLITGQPVTVEADGDGAALPGGIVADTIYYAVRLDLNNVKLSDTQAHAIAGSNFIDITDAGAGDIEIVATRILGMEPREAIDIDFPMKLSEVPSDANGMLCRSIDSVDAVVKFRPTNVSHDQLLSQLQIQGAGAGIGKSLPSADLDIYGPDENPFVRINGATQQSAPAKFGTQEDRVDTQTFKSKRTYNGGVVNPVFYVGTERPQ